MWIEYNPNPTGRQVGDCSIRAIAKALDVDWETAYVMVCMNGFSMGDMPSSDSVWGATLRKNGFYRTSVPDSCPDCYTVEDFCKDHPEGTFVLGFGGGSYARGGRGGRGGRTGANQYGSYARGGYPMEGYSRNEGMIAELRELMMETPDERSKKEFQRFISKMESM